MAQPKKKPGTAVAVWEEQMAAAAHQQAAVETMSGGAKAVSLRGGILSVDDNPIPGNELRCVVVASAFENQLYEGAFNPNDIKQPVCFAISTAGEGMAPHENSSAPQCDSCDNCELNVMGSADTGRGKACKNIRRLLLITEDALESATTLEEAEARSLKVPVTSVRNWAKYVNRISEEMHRPSWGVVTTVSVVQDAKTQFKVQFAFAELVNFDQPLYDAMQSKISELTKEALSPYPVQEEQAPQPSRKAAVKKPAGKPATAPQRNALHGKVPASKRKY